MLICLCHVHVHGGHLLQSYIDSLAHISGIYIMFLFSMYVSDRLNVLSLRVAEGIPIAWLLICSL